MALHDLHTAQMISTGSHGPAWSICLCPDERYIMAGCEDGKILVWRVCVCVCVVLVCA